MDWFTQLTSHPGVVFAVILLMHVIVMDWSWLKSSVLLLIYHTVFLLAIAQNPDRAFGSELAADTRWLLVQTTVLIWLVALLTWARVRAIPQQPRRL